MGRPYAYLSLMILGLSLHGDSAEAQTKWQPDDKITPVRQKAIDIAKALSPKLRIRPWTTKGIEFNRSKEGLVDFSPQERMQIRVDIAAKKIIYFNDLGRDNERGQWRGQPRSLYLKNAEEIHRFFAKVLDTNWPKALWLSYLGGWVPDSMQRKGLDRCGHYQVSCTTDKVRYSLKFDTKDGVLLSFQERKWPLLSNRKASPINIKKLSIARIDQIARDTIKPAGIELAIPQSWDLNNSSSVRGIVMGYSGKQVYFDPTNKYVKWYHNASFSADLERGLVYKTDVKKFDLAAEKARVMWLIKKISRVKDLKIISYEALRRGEKGKWKVPSFCSIAAVRCTSKSNGGTYDLSIERNTGQVLNYSCYKVNKRN